MTGDLEFVTETRAGGSALLRRDLVEVDAALLWSPGEPLSGARGRGGAAVVELRPGVRGVVRDYRRGGGAARLLSLRYFDPRRPARELRVLSALQKLGVPVVAPLAALVKRLPPLGFRLRLITELIEGAEPLPAFVARNPELRHSAVREAGRVVGMAFGAGLRHPDLHPDNLIARCRDGQVEVVLLDLDRATLGGPLESATRDRMLVRMARYLHRHAATLACTPTWTDRLRFLGAMGWSRAERRAVWSRVTPLLLRQLARRGLQIGSR
ncbi:MAG: hypothetical protein KDC87_01090 [Planctomycetes bacterium]|nr:hypothetical protein [Planctomycetota bacterium]MCB9870491.1 hypothetical protein [Planctomycetota bacterium]